MPQDTFIKGFWSLSLDGSQLFWQHGGEGLHYIREVILILWLITMHSHYKSKEKKENSTWRFLWL